MLTLRIDGTTVPVTQWVAFGGVLVFVNESGIAHPQSVRSGQRQHRSERRRMRIVTLNTTQSPSLAARFIPISVGSAVHALLPITVRQPMTFPA